MDASNTTGQGGPQPGATLVPTSVDEWKRQGSQATGFVIELPSGKVARVTRKATDFMAMIKENRIPNPLSEIIMEAVSGKRVELGELDETKMAALIAFIDNMCCQMMLEPRCVIPPPQMIPNPEYSTVPGVVQEAAPLLPNPDYLAWECPDDAVSVEDIDMGDRFFLFNVAIGGTTDLANFRRRQEQAIADSQDGGDVPPAPVDVPAQPVSTGQRPVPGVVS